uniref:Uncharacterized protein n=1 Tax=Rhizophora mucronata TaxID=61149 RepID=A0A2P2NCQ5_RHIMU
MLHPIVLLKSDRFLSKVCPH